jgi:hypothetical protein
MVATQLQHTKLILLTILKTKKHEKDKCDDDGSDCAAVVKL